MLSSRKAAKWLSGMAVAGGLGFGATGAAASVDASQSCPPFNLATGDVGACTSAANCSATCLNYHPQYGGASNGCRRGCCLCAIGAPRQG
jgi:hypothetical protein